MSNNKIVYSTLALDDLDTIFQWIAKESPASAANTLDNLETSISHLSLNPLLGIDCRRKRVRKACRVLIVNPYLVFYRYDDAEKTITVLRVFREVQHYRRSV